MSWFPMGPDFVYTPRDAQSPQRISKRNMYARQAQIWSVAVDPTDSNTIYTIDSLVNRGPITKGGAVAHRTDDGGKSWTSITNVLQHADFTIEPTCIAVHPLVPSYVYMGTQSGAIYVSSDQGQTWGAPVAVNVNPIGQIIVDLRNAANPATTTLYAGTGSGLFVSTNGGASWGATPVLAGVVSSMAFSLPMTGADCYVGIFQQGIFYSTNPSSAASWTVATGNGLPAQGTFDHVWLQYVPATPQRAYCYFESVQLGSVAVCTTSKGGTNWSKINAVGLPASSGFFAVAPNSPGGNGNNDILFLGHLLLSRSTDGGATWTVSTDDYHVDQRSFAFAPPNPPQGTIPTMLVGNDGGLIATTGFADPAFNFGAAPTDYDDGATYAATSGVAQNLNQGKISSALLAYNADPAASALGYIACNDTGLAGHSSALGWRGLNDTGDADQVACTPGVNGVKVWVNIFTTMLVTDTGVPGEVPAVPCTLNGNSIASTSNHLLTLDKTCVTGTQGGPIVNIDQNGTATQISQSLSPPARVVAGSPTDKRHLVCATRDDAAQNNHVFVTSGVALGPTTVWQEAATNRPAGIIASVAIDHAETVFALMQSAVNGTPLFTITGGSWSPLTSTGLPGLPYGRLVADPVTAGVLYAVSGGRVFRIAVGTTAIWTEIGQGLPGTHVEDLWIGHVPEGKVLLRAAVAARGVWECDVTANAVDPPARPYLRDHILDQGWIAPSLDGLVNPYRPADAISVYHYQSADIKVDAMQAGSFFQTDPEGTIPGLSHVLFDVMSDNSENLPGTDTAMAHVQVRNRSYTTLDNVSVWAVYANASAGVPSLAKSPSQNDAFPFWNQFQANGSIVPNLPTDSPWTSVGAPVTLSKASGTGPIDALHPRVASWKWTVPPYVNGDPGHYCMVAFVHSQGNPVGETTNFSVDSIAHSNPQIGQKNLHIVPALSPGPKPPPPPSPRGGGGMREYIEFHNPGIERRLADLVFDLRPLPPQLHVWLQLSELATQAPLEKSLTGIDAIHHPGVADHAKEAFLAGLERGDELLHWFERWLHRMEDRLDGGHRDDRPCHKPHPSLKLAPDVYRAKPASLVAVRDVLLPPHGAAAALIAIENRGELPSGAEYRFQVQQRVGGHVVGGSTYVLRIR